MATTKFNPLIMLTIAIFITHSTTTTTTTKANSNNLHQEKQSHLHFYLHDIVSTPNPTAIRVAAANTTNKSPTTFGAVAILDDPLTEGPDAHSRLIGRAQGTYMFASKEEVGLLMVVNLVFFESGGGGGGGGSVTVVGRNAVKEGVREMAVVGGSGAYRFARGYVLVSTYSLDAITGDTVDEFDVYVEHR